MGDRQRVERLACGGVTISGIEDILEIDVKVEFDFELILIRSNHSEEIDVFPALMLGFLTTLGSFIDKDPRGPKNIRKLLICFCKFSGCFYAT